MSIFLTAYDTRVCNGFVMSKIVNPIEDAFVQGGLVQSDEDKNVYMVQGGNMAADKIPLFAHPVQIQAHAHEKPVIVVDVRHFGKWDTSTQTFRIRNDREYLLAQYRAKLNRVWLDEAPSILQNLSGIPMVVFSSWISEAIRTKLNMEPIDQFKLSVLAAYYYQCLFIDSARDVQGDQKVKMANQIARNMKLQTADVLKVIQDIPVLDGAESFCKQAYEVTQSIRLKGLEPGTLISYLGGTWFGTNAGEIVGCAIEHPPTWLAMLLLAFEDKTYKNTTIMRIAHRNAKGGDDVFLRSAKGMLEAMND